MGDTTCGLMHSFDELSQPHHLLAHGCRVFGFGRGAKIAFEIRERLREAFEVEVDDAAVPDLGGRIGIED